MKKHLLAGVAFAASALIGTAAIAADAPVFTPAPAAPAPMAPAPVFFDWSGLYLGVHSRYAWGDRDLVIDGVDAWSYDSRNKTLGGQIGFNAQFDNLVVGIEGDLAWSNIRGRTAVPFDDPLIGAGEMHDMKWLATIRGRLGFALDRFLVYGIGGVAFAKIDGTGLASTLEAGDIVQYAATDSNTHTGWTIGAGIEGALTDNLSLSLEYNYIDLGSKNYHYAFPPVADGPVTVNADHQYHSVRAALNWRFTGLFGPAAY